MSSRHPSELTVITCVHCGREVTKMRIGQAYCRRPECQRERSRVENSDKRFGNSRPLRSHAKKVENSL
jgi:hypothetical protein